MSEERYDEGLVHGRRVARQVLAEYPDTASFDDLMDAAWDAAFPGQSFEDWSIHGLEGVYDGFMDVLEPAMQYDIAGEDY